MMANPPFVYDADTLRNPALVIQGNEDVDTLSLEGGGNFALWGVKAINSIEILQGSGEDDNIELNAKLLQVFSTIDGGGGSDTLTFYTDDAIDFGGKTLQGVETIDITHASAEVIFDNKAYALLASAEWGDEQHVVLNGAAFTESERAFLFSRGIDQITDRGGTYLNPPLRFDNLDGDVIQTKRLNFIDAGRNVTIANANSALKNLTVDLVDGSSLFGTFGFDTTGAVKLSGALQDGTQVQVDGIGIGTIDAWSPIYFHVNFNQNATAALVQKFIRAVTFDGSTSHEMPLGQQIALFLADGSGHEAQATITFESGNIAPASIALSKTSVVELAASGTVIGDLSATDSPGSSFTYEILRDDGSWGSTDGRFKIEDDQLKVANGVRLDYEQASSHAITIKVTDEGGLSCQESFTISVTDVNPENAVGTSDADKLVAGLGNDVLDGGAGADTLIGGEGNDTYFVDDAGDQVIETATGGMADQVITSISYTLAAYVEHLTASGTAAVALTGNALNNVMTGNESANRINGSAGRDTLNGGAGNDTLTGGSGADRFVFNTRLSKSANLDTIVNFSVKDDTINLENAIFKRLVKMGVLNKNFFTIGSKAKDGNDFVVYNKALGIVSYDADGAGKGAPVAFAKLKPGTLLTHADFYVT